MSIKCITQRCNKTIQDQASVGCICKIIPSNLYQMCHKTSGQKQESGPNHTSYLFLTMHPLFQLPSEFIQIWTESKHLSNYLVRVWTTLDCTMYCRGSVTIWQFAGLPSQGVILIVFIPRNNIWWLSSAEGVILMVLIAATVSDCFYSSEVAVATINTRQQQSHHWMGLKWRRQDGHGKRCINETNNTFCSNIFGRESLSVLIAI